RDELNTDSFHAHGSQLYRVMERQYFDGGKVTAVESTPGSLPEELKKSFPEITYASSFTPWDNHLTFKVGKRINRELGHYAGADWFKMFSFKLLHGKPELALNSPNSLAISATLAKKYFGSPAAAMGKLVRIDNRKSFQVTA